MKFACKLIHGGQVLLYYRPLWLACLKIIVFYICRTHRVRILFLSERPLYKAVLKHLPNSHWKYREFWRLLIHVPISLMDSQSGTYDNTILRVPLILAQHALCTSFTPLVNRPGFTRWVPECYHIGMSRLSGMLQKDWVKPANSF